MSSAWLAFSSAGSSTRLYGQTFRRKYQDDSVKVAIINQKNYLAVQKNLVCLHKERNCNRSWAITNRESLGADEFVKFQVHTCLVCQLVNWKKLFTFLNTCHLCPIVNTSIEKKEKCLLLSRCAVLLNRPYCEEISIRFPFRNYQYTKTPPVNSASAMSVDTKSTNRHQMAKLFNPHPVRFPHTLILLTVPPPWNQSPTCCFMSLENGQECWMFTVSWFWNFLTREKNILLLINRFLHLLLYRLLSCGAKTTLIRIQSSSGYSK